MPRFAANLSMMFNEVPFLDRFAADGYDLLVADTVNHRIASIRLSDGRIRTEAGTGEQLRERSGGGAAHKQPLSSPS